LGLYFYVQNIRFLHSSNLHNSTKIYFLGSEKTQINFSYFALLNVFFMSNGVIYLDDVLLIFTWVFF
jgi:hypothetical protein